MSCPVEWLLVTKTVEYSRRPCTGELVELLLFHRERFEFGLSPKSFKVLLFLQKKPGEPQLVTVLKKMFLLLSE